ncbi:MAG: ATP-binding cassette domain-containing protein [Mycobacterium sp.]|nr:MAG: ATP-binding cassette domain-containing protein [Mycobacterium sp.]
MTGRRSHLIEALRDWRSARSAGLLIALAALLAAVPGLVVPLLVRGFLNQVLVVGDTAWAPPVLIGLTVSAVTAALLVWLQWRTARMVAVRLSAGTTAALMWHLLRLPTAVVDDYGAGALTGRVSALQLRSVQAGLLLPLALVNLLTIVVYAGVLIVLDPLLGAAVCAVVVISVAATYLLLRRREALQDAATCTSLALMSYTTQIVSEVETIKASAAEQWIFDRWSQVRSRAGAATSELEVDGQRLGLVGPLTQVTGLGVVLALGTVLVFRGELDLGTLVAVQGILAALLVPTSQIAWFGVLLEKIITAQRYADEMRAIPVDVEVADRGHELIPVGRPVGLELDGVRFGYGEQPLFDGLDLVIPAGSWVAVVGASGSGKSTLARLCIGELQPWSGRVMLGGVPRRDIARDRRASAIGYVPQYPVLTPGSVFENIRMFDESISEARVIRALESACVMDAIDRRPAGLLEEVDATGHGFSGGELQRLAIARALVHEPGLLVLDEATSALDPVVEAELETRLRELNVTCLVIAHRLSTVRDANEIVVLDGGRIVQRGHFEELRSVGRFQELVHG